MPMPLQITFREIAPSAAVEARIRKRVAKLEEHFGRIVSCRVIVRSPRRHLNKGKSYNIRIDLKLPGSEIAVNRDPAPAEDRKDIYVAIRDAFDAVERRLQDKVRRRRGEVKSHAGEPHGRIARLFADEGYGFIESADGEEVYFHRNSVIQGEFKRLSVGAEVRYAAAAGEKGLQATTVKPVGKHRLLA
ncbi:MAG: HPF/RaiA family ribosome-associated protein [Proteobacteria bacterium]|nr:HPF/RaiA family ribosome-associated protein [Pseudomonadota bacterium]